MSNQSPTILVAGTYDTKDDELNYLAHVIGAQSAGVTTMDISVLGDPKQPTDISKHQVAQAGGHSIEEAIESGDENIAMQIMAKGGGAVVADLYQKDRIDGVIILGGSMGTDAALDICNALPIGVPKYVVSTVAFSPMIPSERLPADVQMILWAGGLYGLNSICKASLSQAAGAVVGAAKAVERPNSKKPMIGMTSFGKTVLRYMVHLKPALEDRGFDVAVFHATGMGGRAFENLAAQGAFACVFDFATQELGNHIHGSQISAGASRLTSAGLAGVPQLVAPGCHDLVDLVGWQPIPNELKDLPYHAHNRLLGSIVLDQNARKRVAAAHGERLAKAVGPTALLLPIKGTGEWDRQGNDLHNADDMATFAEAMRKAIPRNVELHEIDAHINDLAFSETALAIFDNWVETGLVDLN